MNALCFPIRALAGKTQNNFLRLASNTFRVMSTLHLPTNKMDLMLLLLQTIYESWAKRCAHFNQTSALAKYLTDFVRFCLIWDEEKEWCLITLETSFIKRKLCFLFLWRRVRRLMLKGQSQWSGAKSNTAVLLVDMKGIQYKQNVVLRHYFLLVLR